LSVEGHVDMSTDGRVPWTSLSLALAPAFAILGPVDCSSNLGRAFDGRKTYGVCDHLKEVTKYCIPEVLTC
jgi:hypothetical protein